MGLSDIYYSLEEKYYNFLDWLDSKGIPVYSVVDKIDKIMPSFVLVLIIFAIILSGVIISIAMNYGFGANERVITLLDKGGNPIVNADVTLRFEGDANAYKFKTNLLGAFQLESENGKTAYVTLYYRNKPYVKVLDIGEDTNYTLNFDFYTKLKKLKFSIAGVTNVENGVIYFSCSNPKAIAPDDMPLNSSEIEVEVDPECGDLEVSIAGDNIDSYSGVVSDGDVIKLASYDETAESGSNTLIVHVIDSKGDPIDNFDLSLYVGQMKTLYNNYFNVNSPKKITGLGKGTYTVKVIKEGYVAQEQDNNVEFTEDNETKEIRIMLDGPTEKGTGNLAIRVYDDISHNPIIDAKVCLYKNTTDNVLGCTQSDLDGFASFKINDADANYLVGVEAEEYLPRVVKVKVDTLPFDVYLHRKDAEQRCITVKVIDELGLPVYNAMVYLYDSENNLLSLTPKITDYNGFAKMAFCVNEGSYKVYAYKNNYDALSDLFNFDPFTMPTGNADVVVTMPIPNATLDVTVFDEYNNPVPHAVVKIYDSYSDVIKEGSMITDAQGHLTKTGLRADKRIFFVVSKDGFENYVSLGEFLTPNAVNKRKVILKRLSLDRTPRIKVIGLYDTKNEKVSLVAPDHEYKLRFMMILPENDENYKRMYATFIAGDSDIVEKEMFFIQKVKFSSYASVFKGAKLSFEDEYKTSEGERKIKELNWKDEAKWVQLGWKIDKLDINSGIFFVDVYFKTRPELKEGQELKFFYDIALVKTDNEAYYPLDINAIVGYKTNNKNIYIIHTGKGQQTCDDKFCLIKTIFDYENELTSDLVGETPFMLTAGNRYKLNITIMNANKKPLTNYRIIVENPQEMLYFLNYNFKTVENATLEENLDATYNVAKNYKITYNPNDLKPLEENNAIRGAIEFVPNNVGNATIKIMVVEDNRIYYTKEIYFDVVGNKEFIVDYEPKELPSFASFNLIVNVKDKDTNVAADYATVLVKNMFDQLIAKTRTNKAGEATLLVPGQKTNVLLKLEVFKKDYKPYIKELKITDSFIDLNPKVLKLEADIHKNMGKVDLIINNNSEIPIKITKAYLDGDFDKYVDVSKTNKYLKEAFENKIIKGKHKLRLPFIINLTTAAEHLKEIEKYDNVNLVLKFERTDKVDVSYDNNHFIIQGNWVKTIPVDLTIGFGKGLDNLDCLGVDVDKGKLVANNGKVIMDTLTVVNGCTVNNKPVKIYNLEAKVKWKGNSLGNLVLAKDDRDTKLQSAYYRTIALKLEPEIEETYRVSIVPKSGQVVGDKQLELELRASYMTDEGVQFITKKVTYDVSVISTNDCFSFILPENESDLIKVPRDKEVSFKVKNLCKTNFDIRFDTLPKGFIELRPSKFTLNEGEEKTIKVNPKDSPIGVYLLEMRAKTKGTSYSAVKSGINAFRIFVKPLENDCLVLDNYEINIFNTSKENMKYIYLYNKCLHKTVYTTYNLGLRTAVANLGDYIFAPLAGAASGAGSGYAIGELGKNLNLNKK